MGRFLHSADWHLGRILHGVHLTEDQAWILERFVALAKDTKPDAIFLSGDLYDRSQPPAEAVELFSEVLGELVIGLKIPVIAIAGNHDSAERVASFAPLLAKAGLHLAGGVGPLKAPLVIEDAHGPIHIHSIPYAEPVEVRHALGMEEPGHEAAMLALCNRIRAADSHPRKVVLAHAFVAGGEESESERTLSAVGGAGQVSPSVFDGFSYTALGHLHRPQRVGSDRVRYSGSLLKYSFSESQQEKGVSLVEMDAAGGVQVESIPLGARRDLRVIEGTLEEILCTAPDQGRDDYLSICLTDPGKVFDAMGKLRKVYPNVLHLERKQLELGARRQLTGKAVATTSIDQLFSGFFKEASGRDLLSAEAELVEEMVEAARLDKASA
jgi:DNA repair protein SbcD/Mre11